MSHFTGPVLPAQYAPPPALGRAHENLCCPQALDKDSAKGSGYLPTARHQAPLQGAEMRFRKEGGTRHLPCSAELPSPSALGKVDTRQPLTVLGPGGPRLVSSEGPSWSSGRDLLTVLEWSHSLASLSSYSDTSPTTRLCLQRPRHGAMSIAWATGEQMGIPQAGPFLQCQGSRDSRGPRVLW